MKNPFPRPPLTARTDWRLGGRTVRRWREPLLAIAFATLAITLLGAAIIPWLWPGNEMLSTGLLWAGMAGVCAFALSRTRPAGLFRFRPLDLVYGVALALILRTMQGWIDVAVSGAATFPSFTLIDGRPGAESWLLAGIGAIVIAPVVEEMFFRVVVLVTVYNLLRRPFGRGVAATTSVLASTGVFVLAHGITVASDVSGIIAIAMLGLVCGSLVVLTGRIWGAVLVHAIFNTSFVMLAAIGTVWG